MENHISLIKNESIVNNMRAVTVRAICDILVRGASVNSRLYCIYIPILVVVLRTVT